MRTMLSMLTVGLITAIGVEVSGAMDRADDTNSLSGTSWTLSALPGRTLLPSPKVTVHFVEGRVQGSDGCNRYGAPYAADAGSFRITGPIASTQMACPQPVMQQAAAFTAALAAARAFQLDGMRLTLLDGAGTALATLDAQRQELTGTAWKVTGANNGKQAVVSVLAGTELTMAFGTDGRVAGSAGCNNFTAPYTVSGTSVTIGEAATTRKACAEPAGVMEQERAFLAALATAATARVDGDRLELRTAGGALAVTATRQPAGQTAVAGSGGPGASTGTGPAAGGLRLPATFRGDLPCADCEAIRYHLDLWPDEVFHLRREWVGRGLVRDEIGRWRVDPARRALVLTGGAEMPLQFEVTGADTLRALDMAGKPIESTLPYELTSDGTLAPTEVSLLLAGDMVYMADAARFVECLTGRGYPIAMEADYPKLERAYTGAVKEPGAPLLVTFEGSIVTRPTMEGDGTEPTVVVRRFVNVWPGQACKRPTDGRP